MELDSQSRPRLPKGVKLKHDEVRARWTLLAYALVAGMIEYVFLRNSTSGGPLVVLTLSLVVFALTVPVLIAFTVARYD